jgi:tetratricopeptide (TPR) repeat protein
LADTATDAVDWFQRALEQDPYHPRANALLASLLLTLGRLAEARRHIVVAELLFPDDPTFHVLHAVACAVEGKRDEAEKHLRKAETRLGDGYAATRNAVLLTQEAVDTLNEFFQSDPNDPILGMKLAWFLTKRWMDQIGSRTSVTRSTEPLLPLHPLYHKMLVQVVPDASLSPNSLMRLMIRGLSSKETSALVRMHPEGAFFFLHGLVLGKENRLAEASEAFLKAAETPSVIKVRQPALFAAVILSGNAQGAFQPEEKRRVARKLRELAALGNIRPHQWQGLFTFAFLCDEFELAQWFVAEWGRQAPNDLEMLKMRCVVQHKVGDYSNTIATADTILARKPGDVNTQRLRSEAIEKLKQQVKSAGSAKRP